MFNRIADIRKMEHKKDMESYSKELQQTADKRVKEQQFNTSQEKQYELMQALNKKQEHDILNQQSLASKKSMQSILANEYENSMRLKRLQQENERRQNLLSGQATNNKATLELEYLK